MHGEYKNKNYKCYHEAIISGKKKKGQLMAADEAALYELLRGENLFLISCRLAQKEKKKYISSYSKAAF